MITDPTREPLRYPFDLGTGSFRWRQQGSGPLGPLSDVDLTGRQPILAIGSNGAPRQLHRKFAEVAFADPTHPDGSIPVTACVATGIDAVYAAFVAGYGSIPATSCESPGTEVATFVTWLTPRQLDRMNQTESLGTSYLLEPASSVVVPELGRVDDALGYVAVVGPALIDGSPVAIAAVSAENRQFRAMSQTEIWAHVAQVMGWRSDDLSGLAASVGADRDRAGQVARVLAAGRMAG